MWLRAINRRLSASSILRGTYCVVRRAHGAKVGHRKHAGAHPVGGAMAIFLDEPHVGELLDMESCITALEEAFREKAEGAAAIQPRRRLPFQGRRFHLMAASMTAKGYLGFKAYGAGRGQDVVLYKAGEGMVDRKS